MQLRNVLSYYFKNILYMLLFAVAPALFIGCLVQPFGFVEMLYNYPSMTSFTFGEFFTGVYSHGALGILWFAIGFVLLVVFLSFLVGKIEYHFRTGHFEISSHNARGFNNNFGDIAIMAGIMLLVDFILNLVGILLMCLVHLIICGSGAVVLGSIIVNWVIAVVVILMQGVCTCMFMFAAIDMIIMGSPLTVAMSNVFNSYSRHRWSSIIVSALPFLIGIGLTVLGSLCGIVWLSNIVALLFIIPYVCIWGLIDFFEYYNMPRYDNRQYYNLR